MLTTPARRPVGAPLLERAPIDCLNCGYPTARVARQTTADGTRARTAIVCFRCTPPHLRPGS